MSVPGKLACKIVVVGDGSVGKTCMLYSYTNNLEYLAENQNYIRTIFENYQADLPIRLDPTKPPVTIRLSLWDTAGQEEYAPLRNMCYASTVLKGSTPKFDVSVFIVCFAWDNPASYTNVEIVWNKELKKLEVEHGLTGARPYRVILVGTKADLRPGLEGKRDALTLSHALQLQQNIKADAFVECSAKTGEGVRKVFETAVLMWYQACSNDNPDGDAQEKKSCTML